MNSSREEILKKIKSGLKNSSQESVPKPNNHLPAAFKLSTFNKVPEQQRSVLIDRFTRELTEVKGFVKRFQNSIEIKDFVFRLVKERGAEKAAIWESEFLMQINLQEFLLDRDIKLAPASSKKDIAEAGIGITEADFAIADTGTMVLISNPRQPRSVSLVPPIHVAIVRPEVMIENLYCLFEALESSSYGYDLLSRNPSCMTFITGPSRTADIELNLTLGVHGPREVFALILG